MNAQVASDAERMDRHYRWQRHIYDATRTHYLIGRQRLIRQLKPGQNQSVLEIGCGTAWNLVRVARRYPHARCFGVDVSNAMLATARTSLQVKGLAGRVTVAQGDASDFDPVMLFGRSEFDRIFFSYALSMITCWQEALDHAAGLLAPGGELHIVDFGQCDELPLMFKTALFTFLRHYTVTPRASLDRCVAITAQSKLQSDRFERLHRGYTDYAVLTRGQG